MGRFTDKIDFKRAYYNEFCGLLVKQSWLIDKSTELEYLLENNKEKNERDLIIDLLENYSVPDEDTIERFIRDMAVYIKDKSDLFKHTFISAFTRGHEPDSGQVVIQLLKRALASEEVTNYTLCNTLDKLHREMKKNSSIDRIVIVDETVGSGVTLDNQLTYIRNLDGCADIPIIVCVIASIESAVNLVLSKHHNIDFFSPLLLKKGISERFSGTTKDEVAVTMKGMESKLAETCGHWNLQDYSFGYGGAEMLYACKTWNAPNSMFPIFWWTRDKDGKKRKPLFTRA